MCSAKTEGRCLCGQVSFRVDGEPEFSVLCFCEDCQRISGGGHLPQAAFARGRVEVIGAPRVYEWVSDAENTVSLTFCPACGSPLFKATSKMPDTVLIAVGVLHDHSLFTAPHHAFAEKCQQWDLRNA